MKGEQGKTYRTQMVRWNRVEYIEYTDCAGSLVYPRVRGKIDLKLTK